ncbi:MAG: histidinol dehydrogenase [Acidimicrobiales bacterium]
MALTRIDLRGQPGPFEGLLPRPDQPGADVRSVVAGILDRVRAEGDAALRALTVELDGVALDELRVPSDEVAAALRRVPPALRSALELAHDRIVDYHAREGTPPDDVVTDGVTVRHLVRPVARAGCYAPGGRARYPSTVLMCAAPARVAGVAEVVLCVPPAQDGRVDDATLAAAAIAGVDEVYRVGGAQAVAAMAFGTESVGAVDVIVGPGNRYVAEAKRQVSGTVGVAASFAGPSEVVVVAGPGTPPALAAIDLAVQAEHGPDGLAWLVTWSAAAAEAIEDGLARVVAASPRRADLEATLSGGGYCCLVDDAAAAVAVANVVAPEHLELLVDDAEDLLPLVQSAGAVFCGVWSPASLGDYLAGPNHVLPTNRTARFASALRADDFRRHLHAVSATRQAVRTLGPAVVTLATTEGLDAHAESIRMRS